MDDNLEVFNIINQTISHILNMNIYSHEKIGKLKYLLTHCFNFESAIYSNHYIDENEIEWVKFYIEDIKQFIIIYNKSPLKITPLSLKEVCNKYKKSVRQNYEEILFQVL